MKFSHPIFIFKLSDSKEVKILKGMLVLVFFGFNKTKNVNNIEEQLFFKMFEDD